MSGSQVANIHGRRRPCRSKSCVRARKRRLLHPTTRSCMDAIILSDQVVSLFERYVFLQLCIPRSEVEKFITYLRRPLPISFRLRSKHACEEWEKIRHEQRLSAIEIPNLKGSWHLRGPENLTIRSWLSSATSKGHVSRQEYVSMIPVLLLQISRDHAVLDLCASPGSKTIQAVDALYDACNTNDLPTGYVVANELDCRRSYVLAHRCNKTLARRIESVAITCHNACKFPNVEAPLRRDTRQRSSTSERSFDRIICDVPCSGDGTLRKDLKVWRSWHPEYGIELHSLQLRIARRGIALLKIGGLMTYSTCSFHPIENEAVVATLLKTGCVELLPADDLMTGIRYRPGLVDWKVIDDNLEEQRPTTRPKWPRTLWPPTSEDKIARELYKCVRMVPHDNDTGGFFIALLRKIKEFPFPPNASRRGKEPIVTPTPDFHKLFPVSRQIDKEDESHLVFTRASTGSKRFRLSPSLATTLTSRPGSSKLNLVYAGYREGKCIKLSVSVSVLLCTRHKKKLRLSCFHAKALMSVSVNLSNKIVP